ncbi:chemotaxis protein CheB [uncultured Tateyamaria sp.]|uniref:chemotaxis protein CheB n=1 Tax=uncultured Tateyamaria sp. TaxID=455651 RepID=UPI00261CAA96|nr:chemotaxis protein CheB [uncultured Tateyamaria sp.]
MRVVVVDDSTTMQRWLRSVLSKDPRLEVVGVAGSASEARALIKATNPDVLTLDIEMPGMNGIEFLAHLMRLRPMPVVMLASSVSPDSALVRRALAIGALACVPKPTLPTPESMAALCDSVFAAAHGHSQQAQGADQSVYHDKILLVGASTGGVPAIERLLARLPDDIPPIVIAQHMPQSFLESFVRRLDRIGPHRVDFTRNRMRLAPGDIRIAPSAGVQTCVTWYSNAWHIQEIARSDAHSFCPSIDVLFASSTAWGRQVGALLLTGLGSDGAKGMLALRRSGGRTMGQSRHSCVIYGMPGAALALNASEAEADIDTIGAEILSRMQGGSLRQVTI